MNATLQDLTPMRPSQIILRAKSEGVSLNAVVLTFNAQGLDVLRRWCLALNVAL